MKRVFPLLLVGAIYAIGVAVWVNVDRRVSKQAFDNYSAANTGDKGLSLAYRYLGRVQKTSMLTDTVSPETVARNGVVFRVSEVAEAPWIFASEDDEEEKPKTKPKKGEKAKKPEPKKHIVVPLLSGDEEDWVRRGGRLVIALDRAYGPFDVRFATSKKATKVFPMFAGLDTLDLPEPRVLGGPELLRRAHTLFAVDKLPAVARIAMGDGDVILMAAPEIFDNQHIANRSRLAFLTALADGKRPVYFDEVVHGMESNRGALDLLKSWNLGPMLLLAVIAGVLALWRHGRRIGDAEDDYRDTRSEAVDLVRSLGALYERSMTPGEALGAYHRELTRAVAAQTGLRGEALQRRVSDLTGGMPASWKHERLDDFTFKSKLMTLNESFRRLEHAEHS